MTNPFQYIILSRASPLDLASFLLKPQGQCPLEKGVLNYKNPKTPLNYKRQNPGLPGRGSC